MDPEYRAAAFARLSQQMFTEQGQATTTDRIVNMVVEAIPGCEAAGLSVLGPKGEVQTCAYTSPLAAAAVALQHELDEGPCLSAIEDPSTYVINDTASDNRWRQWCPKVATLGVRSVLSVRLSTETNVLGALSLYAGKPAAFTADDLNVAMVFADHAAGALQSAQLVTGLRAAMDSRHLIGIAQGILMQRYGLDRERSFQVLVRYSQDSNIKLRVVAERMVETGSIPGEAATSAVSQSLHSPPT